MDYYVEDSILEVEGGRGRERGGITWLAAAAGWPVVAPGSGSSVAEHLKQLINKTILTFLSLITK